VSRDQGRYEWAHGAPGHRVLLDFKTTPPTERAVAVYRRDIAVWEISVGRRKLQGYFAALDATATFAAVREGTREGHRALMDGMKQRPPWGKETA